MEYKIGDKVKIKLDGRVYSYVGEKYRANNQITEIIKIDQRTLSNKNIYYMKNPAYIPFLSDEFELAPHKSKLDTFLHSGCNPEITDDEVMK